jgi:hypothetical protein
MLFSELNDQRIKVGLARLFVNDLLRIDKDSTAACISP